MATKKQQAADRLAQWNAQQPTGYESQYKPLIDQALGTMQARNFSQSYDAAADPNYQQYAKQYTAAAKAAAENAAANTAALSGGYGSSYAASAAAQAYQDQMSGLDNILPALRAQALNAYNSDTNSLESLLAGLQQQEQQAYSEYAGDRIDWESMRDYLTGNYEQMSEESADFWNNVRSAIQWALSTGVDIYDTYKGYKQQQWENDFQAQQYADSRSDAEREWEQYLAEYAASRSDAEREWEQALRAYEDSRADTAFDQNITSQELAIAQAQLALQQAAAAGAGSYSSSGGYSTAEPLYGNGLSFDDYLKAASQYASLEDTADNYSYLEALYKGLLTNPAAGLEDGINTIYEYWDKGYNDRAIVTRLSHMGYTDEQIAAMMEQASR